MAIFTVGTNDEGSIFEKRCLISTFYILKLLPACWISITVCENHSLVKTLKVQESRATIQFMELRVHDKSTATTLTSVVKGYKADNTRNLDLEI